MEEMTEYEDPKLIAGSIGPGPEIIKYIPYESLLPEQDFNKKWRFTWTLINKFRIFDNNIWLALKTHKESNRMFLFGKYYNDRNTPGVGASSD